jgi:hypothetical protein
LGSSSYSIGVTDKPPKTLSLEKLLKTTTQVMKSKKYQSLLFSGCALIASVCAIQAQTIYTWNGTTDTTYGTTTN